jgi:hypothetical protein
VCREAFRHHEDRCTRGEVEDHQEPVVLQRPGEGVDRLIVVEYEVVPAVDDDRVGSAQPYQLLIVVKDGCGVG